MYLPNFPELVEIPTSMLEEGEKISSIVHDVASRFCPVCRVVILTPDEIHIANPRTGQCMRIVNLGLSPTGQQ